ncbi:hypothetical protein J7K06_00600 [Candidatus Bathyarchaeota archaeon]|nr:hypothetical protein [Candidatus Bathyarchaeota archaeon]
MDSGERGRRKRRDRLYIIAEILDISKDGVLKTQIMYKANLSFSQLNDYLKFLVNVNFLEAKEIDGRIIYKTTEKGLRYLDNYKEILQLLKNTKNDVKKLPVSWINNLR